MKRIYFSLILFLFISGIFAQSQEEENGNKPIDEKEKLQKELNELDKKRELVNQKIQDLDNKSNSTKGKTEENIKQKVEEEAFFKLEDKIVVTASRREQKILEAPAAVYLITREMIRKRGYRTLVDALHDVPGFDFQHLYGNNPELIHQRGIVGESNRTLVYIDGIPDNNINDNAVLGGTVRFPLNNVERIEIVSGPASALYGANAFNGIINIITRDGKKNQGNHVDITHGTYENGFKNPGSAFSFSARGGAKENDFSYSISGYYYKTQGPNMGLTHRLDKPNYDRNDASYYYETQACGGICNPDSKSVGHYWSKTYNTSQEDTYNVSAKFNKGNLRFGTVNWQYLEGEGTFNNGTSFIDTKERGLETGKMDSRNLARAYGVASGILSPQGVSGFPGSSWDYKNNSFHVGYLWNISPTLSLDSEGIVRTTQVLNSSHVYEPRIKSPEAYYRPGEYSVANTRYTRTDQSYQGEERLQYSPSKNFITTAGVVVKNFGATRDYGSSELIHYNVYAGYLQQLYKPVDKIAVTLGYRYDHNTIYGVARSPRVSVVYSITPSLTLKLLHGRGFREPAIKELFSQPTSRKPNPELKPETMQSTEIGIGYSYLKKNYATAHVYYNKIENLILQVATTDSSIINGARPSGATWNQNQNLGIARVYAAELENNSRISENWQVFINYTFSKGEYDNLPSSLTASPSTKGRLGDDPLSDLFYNDLYRRLTGNPSIPQTGPIPTIAPHKINAGFTYITESKWSFHLSMNFVDIRRTVATNPTVRTVPAYNMIKLNILKENFLFAGMYLQLHINNLTNIQFYDPGMRTANGTTFPTMHPLERRNIWITLGYEF